jgi:hypothetical protein
MKNISNKQRKIARKSVKKLPHSTRPFSSTDYAQLPKGN